MNGPACVECGDYSYFTDKEAELIAAAVNSLPKLLEYLEQVLAQREKAISNATD